MHTYYCKTHYYSSKHTSYLFMCHKHWNFCSFYCSTKIDPVAVHVDRKDLRMSWSRTGQYIILLVLCVSPGSVIIVSGQGQMTDVEVLERGDDLQCALMEERERARKNIHQIATSIVSSTCNGTPGWRHVAFINMTNTSYNSPTGLNLTSHSKKTCGWSHTTVGCSSTTFSVGGLPYSRVWGRMRGYQFGSTGAFYHYTQGIDSYYVDG